MTFPKRTRTQSRDPEYGLTLLEVGMALALAAVVIAGLTMYASNASEKMKRRGDAQHLLVFAQAGEAYVTKNQGSLLTGGALDPALHPLGAVFEVSGTELQNDGDLAKSVSAAFGDGQTLELMIRAVPNPSPPPTGSQYLLKAMVVSYGGTAFSDQQAGEIVTLAGAAGGFVSRTIDVTNVDGAGGAWQEPLSDWTHATHRPSVGHVAALVGMSYGASSSTDGPWLARRVIDGGAAPYEHNTMRTDINLSDVFSNPAVPIHHSLLGANSVQANEYMGQTAGADINIGSMTPTSNINIGGLGTNSSINIVSHDPGSPFTQGGNLQIGNNIGVWLTGGNQVPSGLSLEDGGAVLAFQPTAPPVPGAPPAIISPAALTLNTRGATLNASSINLDASHSGAAIHVTAGADMMLSSGTSLVQANGPGASYDTSYYNWGHGDMTAYSDSIIDTTYPNLQMGAGLSGSWVVQIKNPYDPNSAIPILNAYVDQGANPAALRGDVVLGLCDMGNKCSSKGTMDTVDLWVSGYVYSDGEVMKSDRRLKHDIKPLSNVLGRIDQLNGYSFKWNKNGNADIGVIAQEVEKVFPQLVHTDNVSGIKSVEYSNLVAPLIEAVKTLHHMLSDAMTTFSQQIAALQHDDHTLQTQVQTLTEQNAALKAELAQQQLDVIKLKYAIHQPLTAGERTLCGAACAP